MTWGRSSTRLGSRSWNVVAGDPRTPLFYSAFVIL
jgi:hypothetical protein